VARAQQGDAEAMNRLLSRHYDRLYAVCRRVAGNDADAADGCQEALLAIVRGIDRFDGRSSFRTWSYRVATNACLDELRRRKRRPVAVEEITEEPTDEPGHDDRLADHLTLTGALDQLAEDFRVPIVLRDVAGFDYAEIAATLNIPPGTVRSRIARGRRHLAGILGNQTAPDQRPTE
jgi:RNA polymerase sigma-70 factor (ECF subfamily)